MKNVLVCILACALASLIAFEALARMGAAPEPKLAHMVFFGLKDHSRETRDKVVAACEKYLSGHDGCISFSVGARAADVDEPVSVKDFDVALHVVFSSKEGKLKYLKSPRHDRFVEEIGPLFEKVWVFDSYLVKE